MNEADPGREPAAPQLVVGVGMAADDIGSLQQLLSALSDDCSWSGPCSVAVIVQQLADGAAPVRASSLASYSDLRIVDAEQGVRLAAGSVYLNPPDMTIAVQHGRIVLNQPHVGDDDEFPIDYLLNSLAAAAGGRAAGVLLSATACDGAIGLQAIKAAGGLALALPGAATPRSPLASVQFAPMDLVAEPPAIAQALLRMAKFAAAGATPRAAGGHEDGGLPEHGQLPSEAATARVVALLEAETDFDVGIYKSSTLSRRMFRRIALIGLDTVDGYLERLDQDPAERRALLRDLLIPVTAFFRDREAFDVLRQMVIDPMVRRTPDGSTLRGWVAGCATGEEAYSVAMEILDAIAVDSRQIGVQILATDLDESALTAARQGIYAASSLGNVAPRLLDRYFRPIPGNGYEVTAQLRDVVSFAQHGLSRDPPFSRMDLVTCRNVLIYLRPPAQHRVVEALHFALNPGGFLFLGPSESTGQARQRFAAVSARWRIYRSLGTPRRQLAATPGRAYGVGRATAGVQARQRSTIGRDAIRQTVLQARVAPTVVVSEHGAVLFMHGELRPYMRFPEGESPQLTFPAMLASEVAPRVRAAVLKCRRQRETVVVTADDAATASGRVRITATLAAELEEGAVIISFEPQPEPVAPPPAAPPGRATTPAQQSAIEQLESDLAATREDLQHAVEELEIAHEEAFAVREELQASSEELEATAEEMRSLNDELSAANAKLREQLSQLSRAHDDLHNFFASTKIATLFLDDNRSIKRFTPAAAQLLHLMDDDLGRPVQDLSSPLLGSSLGADVTAVLEQLSPQTRELTTRDGRWIARQVLPYRT
ncbi:MAG: CheR family methyltransferase, partial [Pseudomonadales bacterium]